MENKERIVIIDGNSLINRAYYAIQKPMITSAGMYTQGIYGFLSMLSKIRKDYSPTHMLVAFDRKAPTFRHMEYKEYKAGRRKMPLELAMEIPVLKDILDAMGIRRFETDGYEADDIIGTTAKMAEEAGLPAFVITGDKDALQLASDKTSVIITKKGISEFKLYDEAAMLEEYGFGHESFIDYKALRGDPSDNIPGIPGVGEKTAIKLIKQFGSLENLLAKTDEVENRKLGAKIEENAMSAMMSKRLATIVTNVPVDYSVSDTKIKAPDVEKLSELYGRLEFKVFLNRLLKEHSKPRGEKYAGFQELSSSDSENFEKEQALPTLLIISEKAEARKILKKIFGRGRVTLDIICDDNHVGIPKASRLELLSEGASYAVEAPDLPELLRETLKDASIEISGFRLGRFYYFLASNGISLSGTKTEFDCALARYLISPSETAPGLQALILENFGVNIAEEGNSQFNMFDEAEKRENTALKLMYIEKLRAVQEIKIKKLGLEKVFYDIELPLCKVLASMEAEGIHADGKFLESFGRDLGKKITVLEEEIHSLAGEKFNVNSPLQLGNILFAKLGLPAGKKTKRGYSTSADILEKLAPDHLIVRKILEYRSLSKLKSTYAEGMLPLIAEDGKIHAHFRQTVTATGRISCTEPNLQNIPIRTELGRQLRKAFTAESEDYVFMGADYSQIELRVLAHMSKDETLISAFNHGLDIHRETASRVFGVPFDAVSPEMRSNAKAVNFGVIYGMSSFGLSSELTITRKQAENFINDYFERFPDVKTFLDSQVALCRQKGESRTLFGRRRSIPEINASGFMTRQLGERLAMNTPIQGTAADIIKIAMIKVYDALAAECPKSKLILQIHDELIIQAHKSEAEKVKKILSDCMEHAAELLVRLDISLGLGENWYDLK